MKRSITLLAAAAASAVLAQPAQAAGLVGSASFVGTGQAIVSGTGVDFLSNPTSLLLQGTSGDFAGFGTGFVFDFDIAGSTSDLLDLGSLDGDFAFTNTEDFTITLADLGAAGTVIGVGASGVFTGGSVLSNGVVSFSFQTTEALSDVESAIFSGSGVTASFSGATASTGAVPEPLTVIGSGIALAMGAAAKRRLG